MLHKDLAKNFAVVLQKQRKSKRVSQAGLAEKADCDSTMISLIERKIRNPTLNLADSLAQGLDIPLSQMIKDAEDLRRNERTKKNN
jgi:transcriptional regulator with XRE-family HTH domain